MKVNIKKEKTEPNRLYKRFGKGVHLIQNRDDKKYTILVLCSNNMDAIFIDKENRVLHTPSPEIRDRYNFYNWKYIKKLESHEIVINVDDEEVNNV